MRTPTTTGSIVIGHDNSTHSAAALAWGLRQAAAEHRPVDIVHLLHVTEAQHLAWTSASAAGLRALGDYRDQTTAQLDEVVHRAEREHPALRIRAHAIEGDARHGLIGLSDSAHLIVLGSHGRGPLLSPLLGSVSAAVTRRARCPVVVVRPPRSDVDAEHAAPRGFPVGIDGTAESRPVAEFAFAFAALHGHGLTAVHCTRDVLAGYVGDIGFPADEDLNSARVTLAECMAGLAEKYPDVEVTRHLNRGLLGQFVTGTDTTWDLVVVGACRHSGLHRLVVGSTTTAMLERAHCPVAVVPEGRTWR